MAEHIFFVHTFVLQKFAEVTLEIVKNSVCISKFHGNGLCPLIQFQQCNGAWFLHGELKLVGPTRNTELFPKRPLVLVALLLLDLQWDPTFVLGQLESNLGKNLCFMDVFVTYVLGVDFTPSILLGTYYRVKTAAESTRGWERCPLLLARGACAR